MGLPSGLRFRDRIAEKDGAWYFLCSRTVHGKHWKRFDHEKDAKNWLAYHDTTEHSGMLRRQEPEAETRLGDLATEFLRRCREQVERGDMSPLTENHYTQCAGFLERGFGSRTQVETIGPNHISRYVRWRKAKGTTEGARIVKELKSLRTMMRWKGLPVARIVIDRYEIRPQKNERRRYTAEEIQAFVRALPEGSVARAYVVTKLRTGIREVELRAAKVGDLDTEHGILRYQLRDKSSVKPRLFAFPLPADALELLRDLVKGRGPTEPLFFSAHWKVQPRPIAGRTLQDTFRRASEEAGIDPPILSVGGFRHEFITRASNTLGVEITSGSVGHRSVQTTQGYVMADEAEDIRRKRALAEALAGQLPL